MVNWGNLWEFLNVYWSNILSIDFGIWNSICEIYDFMIILLVSCRQVSLIYILLNKISSLIKNLLIHNFAFLMHFPIWRYKDILSCRRLYVHSFKQQNHHEGNFFWYSDVDARIRRRRRKSSIMENMWHFVIEIFHVKCQLIKCLKTTQENMEKYLLTTTLNITTLFLVFFLDFKFSSRNPSK